MDTGASSFHKIFPHDNILNSFFLSTPRRTVTPQEDNFMEIRFLSNFFVCVLVADTVMGEVQMNVLFC